MLVIPLSTTALAKAITSLWLRSIAYPARGSTVDMMPSLIAGTVMMPSGSGGLTEKKNMPVLVIGAPPLATDIKTGVFMYLIRCLTSTQPVIDAKIDATAEALASIASTVKLDGAKKVVAEVLPLSSCHISSTTAQGLSTSGRSAADRGSNRGTTGRLPAVRSGHYRLHWRRRNRPPQPRPRGRSQAHWPCR